MVGRCTFTSTIFIRAEPDLRRAVAAAARREGVTASELIRRELRRAVAQHVPHGAEARAA